MLRAFSTGREAVDLLDDIGVYINDIAFDAGWQKRFAEEWEEAAQRRAEKRRKEKEKGWKSRRAQKSVGRAGYNVAFMIQVVMLQCILRKDYREMAALLRDSIRVRKYLVVTGTPDEDLPRFQTIADWVKDLSPDFLREVNDHIVKEFGGKDLGMVLEEWRGDASAVESNIHYPADSALLRDSLRWMHRWIERLRALGIRARMNADRITYEDGHRIYLEIIKIKRAGLKGKKARRKLMRKLIGRTKTIVAHFQRHLEKGEARGVFEGIENPMLYAQFARMREEWERLKPLIEQGMEQARQRVVEGETVANDEKLLSLWEEHSRVIVRGKAGVAAEFGHKATLWESAEGMILVGDIYEKGNPRECEVLAQEVKELKRRGFHVKKASLDRGYWDEETIEKLKKAGTEVFCPKKGKKDKERKREEKKKEFRARQRFRVGIEGTISVLIRRHSLRRARLKKWEGFQRHVYLCVIGMNLLRLVDAQKRKEWRDLCEAAGG